MFKLDRILSQEGSIHKFIFSKDSDALTIFANKVNFIHIPDRFGYLNQFSNWNYIDHSDQLPITNYTGNLSDIVLKRAEEIYSKSIRENKKIYVYWSGGVDSSAIILALLAVASNRNNITILYTKSSIEEYPKLYTYLQSFSDLQMILISVYDIGKYAEQYGKTDIVITGFPADQLFGSIINQRDDIIFGDDWRKFIVKKTAIEQFEAAFQHYNLPVTTIEQFTWFMNFACKWKLVIRAIPMWFGCTDDGVIPFYDTQDFQNWSMSNFDKLHIYDQKNPKYYKYELKQFINSQFPDKEYLEHKGKLGSIRAGVQSEPLPHLRKPYISFIDGDGILHIEYYHSDIPYDEYQSVRMNMLNRKLIKYRKK